MKHRSQALPSVALVATSEILGGRRKVQALRADARWQGLITPVTKLKVRLDRVLNQRAWDADEVTADDLTWMVANGFRHAERPSGTGVDADVFAAWIVGPFRTRPGDGRKQQLARVPVWSTVGWRRRRHQAENLADACERRRALDDDTVAGLDGTARWIKPLPLVVCAEGKHRAEMHAEFFDDQLVNLDVDQLPDATNLRLKRVVGAPGMLALQCRSSEGWLTALLPFAELSLPIFEAIGVPAPDQVTGWWFATPWSTALCAIAQKIHSVQTSRVGLAMKPWTIRYALMRAEYV